jgi:hypothetical protein
MQLICRTGPVRFRQSISNLYDHNRWNPILFETFLIHPSSDGRPDAIVLTTSDYFSMMNASNFAQERAVLSHKTNLIIVLNFHTFSTVETNP